MSVEASSVALAFPGQGIARAYMSEALARLDAEPLVRRMRQRCGIEDLTTIDLRDTRLAQPATYTCSLLRSRVAPWSEITHAVGHSLGEITALVAAGSLEPDEGLDLVIERGRLSHQAAPAGEMTAVIGLTMCEVELVRRTTVAATGGVLDIAAENSPRQFVLSGDGPAVRAASDAVVRAGGLVERLPIGGGFHSSLMTAAADLFASILATTPIRPPRLTWVSSIDAAAHDDPEDIRRCLARALVLPVRWVDTATNVMTSVARIIDVGPGQTLRKLGPRIPGVRMAELDLPTGERATT